MSKNVLSDLAKLTAESFTPHIGDVFEFTYRDSESAETHVNPQPGSRGGTEGDSIEMVLVVNMLVPRRPS